MATTPDGALWRRISTPNAVFDRPRTTNGGRMALPRKDANARKASSASQRRYRSGSLSRLRASHRQVPAIAWPARSVQSRARSWRAAAVFHCKGRQSIGIVQQILGRGDNTPKVCGRRAGRQIAGQAVQVARCTARQDAACNRSVADGQTPLARGGRRGEFVRKVRYPCGRIVKRGAGSCYGCDIQEPRRCEHAVAAGLSETSGEMLCRFIALW